MASLTLRKDRHGTYTVVGRRVGAAGKVEQFYAANSVPASAVTRAVQEATVALGRIRVQEQEARKAGYVQLHMWEEV